jgi:type VI secretion system protein ImpK
MREDIAELVHPVLSYGLLLQERLKRGDSPDFDTEQAVLKGRLGTELEARRVPEYGGDSALDNGAVLGTERFLGIRYALACWLDEIFILDSPWSRAWAEKQFESALYGSNDRAFRFWEQARLAEVRGSPDALEAFYLCVMLGFRGEMVGKPERLQGWVQAARTRLNRSLPQELSLPPEQEVRPDVPPRYGRDKLQLMVMAWAAVLLLLVPVVVFIVAYLTLHR